eukprot:NODE_453_length_3035_cov_4.710454.p1 GENE.NODE_453_length_3035_cov_4.710454~~NODE_453_length_3035_cov_4.710454.p1  ORF type:complete len:988 (+),score=294.90 NODE_453_length_3035_cov_4.710454:391-2964(+)
MMASYFAERNATFRASLVQFSTSVHVDIKMTADVNKTYDALRTWQCNKQWDDDCDNDTEKLACEQDPSCVIRRKGFTETGCGFCGPSPEDSTRTTENCIHGAMGELSLDDEPDGHNGMPADDNGTPDENVTDCALVDVLARKPLKSVLLVTDGRPMAPACPTTEPHCRAGDPVKGSLDAYAANRVFKKAWWNHSGIPRIYGVMVGDLVNINQLKAFTSCCPTNATNWTPQRPQCDVPVSDTCPYYLYVNNFSDLLEQVEHIVETTAESRIVMCSNDYHHDTVHGPSPLLLLLLLVPLGLFILQGWCLVHVAKTRRRLRAPVAGASPPALERPSVSARLTERRPPAATPTDAPSRPLLAPECSNVASPPAAPVDHSPPGAGSMDALGRPRSRRAPAPPTARIPPIVVEENAPGGVREVADRALTERVPPEVVPPHAPSKLREAADEAPEPDHETASGDDPPTVEPVPSEPSPPVVVAPRKPLEGLGGAGDSNGDAGGGSKPSHALRYVVEEPDDGDLEDIGYAAVGKKWAPVHTAYLWGGTRMDVNYGSKRNSVPNSAPNAQRKGVREAEHRASVQEEARQEMRAAELKRRSQFGSEFGAALNGAFDGFTEEQLHEMFEKMDVDGNGEVDKRELYNGLITLGMANKQAQEIMLAMPGPAVTFEALQGLLRHVEPKASDGAKSVADAVMATAAAATASGADASTTAAMIAGSNGGSSSSSSNTARGGTAATVARASSPSRQPQLVEAGTGVGSAASAVGVGAVAADSFNGSSECSASEVWSQPSVSSTVSGRIIAAVSGTIDAIAAAPSRIEGGLPTAVVPTREALPEEVRHAMCPFWVPLVATLALAPALVYLVFGSS